MILESGETKSQAGVCSGCYVFRLSVLQLSGTWYVKAMVCDNNRTEGKGPKKVFPMTVTALEEGDLEVEITFW